MIEPNNDTLAEMLEGTRDALEKALLKIAKLEAEKRELANMVLIYADRAEMGQERNAKERATLLEEAHRLVGGRK